MKSCEKCRYVAEGTNYINKQKYNICTLSGRILYLNCAEDCNYYNLDLSNEKICMNCKYFIGGGDWGLGCKKDYYRLPNRISKACVEFE